MTHCSLALPRSVAYPNGEGENGLIDVSIELDHHRLWEIVYFLMVSEFFIYLFILLGFLYNGSDVELPFEVLRDCGSQESKRIQQW